MQDDSLTAKHKSFLKHHTLTRWWCSKNAWDLHLQYKFIDIEKTNIQFSWENDQTHTP